MQKAKKSRAPSHVLSSRKLVKPFYPISRPKVLLGAPANAESDELEKLFLLLGLEVDRVSDGRSCVDEALARISSQPYNMVIASLELFDLDGFSVISLLRENKYFLPLVTVSSSRYYALEEFSLAIGSNGHFHFGDVQELSCFTTSITQIEETKPEAA